jgi:hypothetical protein
MLPQDVFSLYFADWLQIIVIGLVFLLSVFFISFLGKNKDHACWQFIARTLLQMIIAACFGSLLFGGLSLAAISIEILFDVPMSERVYGNLSILCLLLFAPLYFLANIPGRDEKHEPVVGISPTLKITGLYILMPLLAVYTVILYAYLIRIVAVWELPDGWVSWLVSALALGGLLVITIIYPMRTAGNRWVERFSRYAGIAILPLLALMTVGIVRRFSDYGVTINRCYILLLNIWFYGIYIYLYFSRARHIKWILITPVAIVMIASTGPWKFSSITKHALSHRIETILDSRKLDTSNSGWLNELSWERKLEIRETISYLTDNYGKESVQDYFKDNIEDRSMYAIFADLKLNRTETENEIQWFAFYNDTGSTSLDLKEYKSGIVFFFNEHINNGKMENNSDSNVNIEIKLDSSMLNIRIIPGNRSVSFPIKDIALEYISHLNKQETAILMETSDNDDGEMPVRKYLLVITEMSGNYYTEKDSLTVNNLKGTLFFN